MVIGNGYNGNERIIHENFSLNDIKYKDEKDF
jgi:hypothetical protein